MINDLLRQPPRMVTGDKIRSALSFKNLIPALAEGFRDYYAQRAVVPPITNIDMLEFNGELHIRTGYMIGGDSICVKIVTYYYNNPSIGLPTRDGIIILADSRTGRINLVLYDGGLITNMRAAGASAVAVQALALDQPITLGLVGAGIQAYWHAAAIPFVREVIEVRVWARRTERAREFARRIADEFRLNARYAPIEEVADSNVIVTATPAREPVLKNVQLKPGTLIVAMGADAVGKRELGPEIFDRVSFLVPDSLQQCQKVGEFQWFSGKPYHFRVEELGAILSGAVDGRRQRDEVIVFDSTGVGFQDYIGATEVLRQLST